MTVKELSQLYWLNKEVKQYEKQLAQLEAELKEDCAELEMLRAGMDGLHSMNMDGMPHGSGVSNPVESTVAQIMTLEEALRGKHEAATRLKALIAARHTVIVLERDRLEHYIASIDDSNIRRMFTLRFVERMSWDRVSAGMGAGYGVDAVKKTVYRYIRQH